MLTLLISCYSGRLSVHTRACILLVDRYFSFAVHTAGPRVRPHLWKKKKLGLTLLRHAKKVTAQSISLYEFGRPQCRRLTREPAEIQLPVTEEFCVVGEEIDGMRCICGYWGPRIVFPS